MIFNHRVLDSISPQDPQAPTAVGTFWESVCVGSQTRGYLAYIPEGARASAAGVMVLPSNGCSAADMFEKSTWRQIADAEPCKEKLIIVFLEPQNGGWNVAEPYGFEGGDAAYVDAVFNDVMRRNRFCIHESKCYLVGYGAGSVLAEKSAMWNPAVYAGLVCVSDQGVEDDYIRAVGQAPCQILHGYEDFTGKYGYKKSDIPLPVWLIDTGDSTPNLESSARYWKSAIRAGAESIQLDPDTRAVIAAEPPPFAVNRDQKAYRVWESRIPHAGDNHGYFINQRIWKDFLYGVRRWMGGPGGDLRLTADPVRELHAEYHCQIVDGWQREWYIYVPKVVRECPQQECPVVFALHGYSCTGEIYIGNSGWCEVAEARGFIAVFPTAVPDTILVGEENRAAKKENILLPAWNLLGKPDRPDELQFFKHMLGDLAETYRIDHARVYATGHSWGSMMTQYLGMSMPTLFAGIAPCSGVLFAEHDEKLLANPQINTNPQADLPIWMFVGENEPWLIPAIPETGNQSGKTIRLWWERNRMPGSPPENFSGGWHIHAERWNDLIYDKNGVPMIRYTWVEALPHATMPEMSYRIWDEFFSKLARGEIE